MDTSHIYEDSRKTVRFNKNKDTSNYYEFEDETRLDNQNKSLIQSPGYENKEEILYDHKTLQNITSKLKSYRLHTEKYFVKQDRDSTPKEEPIQEETSTLQQKKNGNNLESKLPKHIRTLYSVYKQSYRSGLSNLI